MKLFIVVLALIIVAQSFPHNATIFEKCYPRLNKDGCKAILMSLENINRINHTTSEVDVCASEWSGIFGKLKSHDCNVWKNLKCAAHIAGCIGPCSSITSIEGCIDCMAQWWDECCPCINNDIPGVHVDCGKSFMPKKH